MQVSVFTFYISRYAMIPVMYPFSRFFDIPSTAMVILKSVNIFIGTTSTLAIFVLELLAEEDKVQLSW